MKNLGSLGLPAAAFSSEGAKIAGRPDVAWGWVCCTSWRPGLLTGELGVNELGITPSGGAPIAELPPSNNITKIRFQYCIPVLKAHTNTASAAILTSREIRKTVERASLARPW
jgi:hypothetical protein